MQIRLYLSSGNTLLEHTNIKNNYYVLHTEKIYAHKLTICSRTFQYMLILTKYSLFPFTLPDIFTCSVRMVAVI